MFKLLPVLLVLASCSSINSIVDSIKPKKFYKKTANRELWIGQPRDHVVLHPVYATMPMDTRTTGSGEVITYQNIGQRGTAAECGTGAWGKVQCKGKIDDVVCRHVFVIKGDKVANYERSGACSDAEETRFRPRHEDGSAMISQFEKDNYDSIDW